MPDLSGALQECLAAMDEKRDLHQVLRRYPNDREELIALLRLSVDIGGLGAPPADPAFRLRARNTMLAAAVRRRQQRRWNPLAALPRPALRLGAAAAVGVALLVGGLGAAAASSTSLPGDAFYTVKLGIERAQLAMTFDTAARARLQLHFADVRLEEAQRLFTTGRVQDGVRLVGQYDAEVAQFNRSIVATSLDNQTRDDLTRIVADRQARADASLKALAGSLAAGGNSEAAAAVTRTQSHVDLALGGSKANLQGHSGGSAAGPGDAAKPAGRSH